MAKAASMRSCRPARTWIAELKDGKVTSFEVTPEDVGLERGNVADLQGRRCRAQCRSAARRAGRAKGAFRDAAVMTAGAALLVAGKAKTLRRRRAHGARQSIDQRRRAQEPREAGQGVERLSHECDPATIGSETPSVLDKIAAYKREEVAQAKAEIPSASSR